MATVLRAVRHEDQLQPRRAPRRAAHAAARLPRSRSSSCFGLAFWQNDRVLEIVNRPFIKATSGQKAQRRAGQDADVPTAAVGEFAPAARGLRATPSRPDERRRAPRSRRRRPSSPSARRPLADNVPPRDATTRDARRRRAVHRRPSRSPPTPRCCVALPIILWQLYAFILPAFSPRERKVALPLMLMVPFLFIAGRRCSRTSSCCRARSRSCRTSTTTTSTSSSRRRTSTSSRSSRASRSGRCSRCPIGDPRADADGDRVRGAAAREPPLRDPRHRRPGHAAARHRPDHACCSRWSRWSSSSRRLSSSPPCSTVALARNGRGGRRRRTTWHRADDDDD